MVFNIESELSDSDVNKILEKFKDLDLSSHYDFNSVIETPLEDSASVAEFLKNNKPIIFEINESNVLYYKLSTSENSTVFTIDVETSFVKSDSWLYDRLIPVPEIFPTVMEGKISNEMSSFYVCMVISSVFGGVFEEEFLEILSDYNLKMWQPKSDEGLTLTELVTSWIQLGSKYIKMVASAAKYALVREKQKKHVPSALQLPQDVVLELNKTIRDVDAIRHEYDQVLLDSSIHSKMSKLEIKVFIADRDKKIQSRITSDSKIYQIWRLMNLNSNVIPPDVSLKF